VVQIVATDELARQLENMEGLVELIDTNGKQLAVLTCVAKLQPFGLTLKIDWQFSTQSTNRQNVSKYNASDGSSPRMGSLGTSEQLASR
jgi:hypothetical protein